MNSRYIRFEPVQDFNAFAKRMRLQHNFHGQNDKPHPFHVKSNWEPTVQPSIALETYLEEVKIQLAEIILVTPRKNLPERERKAIKNSKVILESHKTS